MAGVVDEVLVAEEAALAALGDDDDGGLVHDGDAAYGAAGAEEFDAIEGAFARAVELGQLLEERGHAAAVFFDCVHGGISFLRLSADKSCCHQTVTVEVSLASILED